MESGKDLLGPMLGCFKVQVGGLGPKLEVWDALMGSILGLVGREWGFGRSRGNRAAGDPQMGPTWAQLEPTWSQLGSMWGPDCLK